MLPVCLKSFIGIYKERSISHEPVLRMQSSLQIKLFNFQLHQIRIRCLGFTAPAHQQVQTCTLYSPKFALSNSIQIQNYFLIGVLRRTKEQFAYTTATSFIVSRNRALHESTKSLHELDSESMGEKFLGHFTPVAHYAAKPRRTSKIQHQLRKVSLRFSRLKF